MERCLGGPCPRRHSSKLKGLGRTLSGACALAGVRSLDLALRPVWFPQAPFRAVRRSVFGFSVRSGEKGTDLGVVDAPFFSARSALTGCIVLGEGWARVLVITPFAIHSRGYNRSSRGIGHPVLFVLGLLTPCQCCKTPSRDGL